jgi:hypothetical protein
MACSPALSQTQPPAAAQTVELGATIRPGDKIFVTDRNGTQVGGRFLRYSPHELALLVDGRNRVIPSDGIGRIEKRDPLWNGMLIGAVPAALVGMAAAGASCSPDCGRDVTLGMLAFGAIGAGVGALIDFGIHGYSIIDGEPLASSDALRVPTPVASLDELWRRVRQGDKIDVATIGARNVTGKFVRVSDTFVTLMVDGKQREIPSNDVRRVTRRGGSRYRSGALWGGAIAGTMGLVTFMSCSGNGCGNPLFVAMFTGSAGALWGAAIGAVIPKHAMVYKSDAARAPGAPHVRIVPAMAPGSVGVAFSATF